LIADAQELSNAYLGTPNGGGDFERTFTFDAQPASSQVTVVRVSSAMEARRRWDWKGAGGIVAAAIPVCFSICYQCRT
jgi:hypothetical protein